MKNNMKWYPIPIRGLEHYAISRSGEVLNTRFNRKLKPSLMRGRYSKFVMHKKPKGGKRRAVEIQCNTLMDTVFGVRGASDGNYIAFVDRNPMNPRISNLTRAKRTRTWDSSKCIEVVAKPVGGGETLRFKSVCSAAKHLGLRNGAGNIHAALDKPYVRYGFQWSRASSA